MKKVILCASIMILPFMATSQNSYPKFEDPINVIQFQLKNGLTVVLSENHEKPTVVGGVVVKAGGKNDPSDATGIAHYLEHMLFKGTQDLGTIDYAKEKIYLDKIDSLYEVLGQTKDADARKKIQNEINEQSKLAGQYAIPNEMDGMLSEIGSKGVNAFTSNDMTVYHNEFPSNKMEEWLSIYAHRFVNPVFRLFQSELETVYEEKNRGDESPFNYAFEVFMKNFYKNHPYGQQTIIGKTEHLKNPSLKKMYDFYNTYYVANNMVLIMVGDFNTEQVKPLIEEYFSSWRSGVVPPFPTYKEEDFKKGESVTIRATPIRAFARGYRTPKFGTYDEIILQIVSNILSNDQKSGLLNQLVNEGKVMEAAIISEPFEDYGTSVVFAIPKLLGQSFKNANALVDSVFERLITGNFSDELFEGAKDQWILDFENELENSRDCGFLLASIYGNNLNWFEYVNFIKAVKTIDKAQVVEVAKKYFSKNYLTLYSRMGKHKTEKLQKPGYDPIIPDNKTHSEFYKQWSKIQSDITPEPLISLKEKIKFEQLNNEASIRMVKNPVNEIFNLDIVWENGFRQNPNLEILGELLNNSTSDNLSLTEFKNKLYALGTTFDWTAGNNEFTLSLTGLDKNFSASLEYLNELIKHPVISTSRIATVAKQIKTGRKVQIQEPQFLNTVLNEYVKLGESSRFMQQPSSKQFKEISVQDFENLYATLKDLRVHVNYVGGLNDEQVVKLVNNLSLVNGQKSSDDFALSYAKQDYNVFYLNNNKSVQSHINFLAIGNLYDKNKDLSRNAFNYYFGYDMSSILFQEIREFRSLAYSTYGYESNGRNPNAKNVFTSYVGCQGDKSPESIKLLKQLIEDMPIKNERASMVENSIKNLIENSNPSFRDYISLYDQSKLRGYDDNLNLELKKQLSAFNFNDIFNFYNSEIKPLKLTLSVVGNKKKFDTKILENYGKVKEVKLKDIYHL